MKTSPVEIREIKKTKPYEVHDYISAMHEGLPELGCGCFARVFAKSQRRVLKVSGVKDDGYFNFVMEVIALKKPNPYFPQFHSITRVFNARKSCDQYIIEMERLRHPNCSDDRHVLNHVVSITEDVMIHDRPIPASMSPNYKSAIRVLKRLVDKYGIDKDSIDIHNENIMIRRGGQLVITDPFS